MLANRANDPNRVIRLDQRGPCAVQQPSSLPDIDAVDIHLTTEHEAQRQPAP
jgi:hypothetical protein